MSADLARHIAQGDCEAPRGGWLGQPANAASSLAYVAAGAAMVAAADSHPARRQAPERALAWATIAAGWGSVAYHGPGGRPSQVAHDASLLAMLGLLVVADLAVLRPETDIPPAALVAVPVAAVVASRSRHNLAAQGVVGLLAVGAEAARLVRSSRRSPSSSIASPSPGPSGAVTRRIEPAVFAGAATLHWTGRSGGALCRPRSWFQAHALWHAATAATLWLRATEVSRP